VVAEWPGVLRIHRQEEEEEEERRRQEETRLTGLQ
jgi:hypothetical protein